MAAFNKSPKNVHNRLNLKKTVSVKQRLGALPGRLRVPDTNKRGNSSGRGFRGAPRGKNIR